jgi:hypothetical protein
VHSDPPPSSPDLQAPVADLRELIGGNAAIGNLFRGMGPAESGGFAAVRPGSWCLDGYREDASVPGFDPSGLRKQRTRPDTAQPR